MESTRKFTVALLLVAVLLHVDVDAAPEYKKISSLDKDEKVAFKTFFDPLNKTMPLDWSTIGDWLDGWACMVDGSFVGYVIYNLTPDIMPVKGNREAWIDLFLLRVHEDHTYKKRPEWI